MSTEKRIPQHTCREFLRVDAEGGAVRAARRQSVPAAACTCFVRARGSRLPFALRCPCLEQFVLPTHTKYYQGGPLFPCHQAQLLPLLSFSAPFLPAHTIAPRLLVGGFCKVEEGNRSVLRSRPRRNSVTTTHLTDTTPRLRRDPFPGTSNLTAAELYLLLPRIS